MITSLILPVWIWVYQEQKYNKEFFNYENKIKLICLETGYNDNLIDYSKTAEENIERISSLTYNINIIKKKLIITKFESDNILCIISGSITNRIKSKKIIGDFKYNDIIIVHNSDRSRYTIFVKDVKIRIKNIVIER
jgi:hypothetical protein